MTPYAWFQLLYADAGHGWLSLCHKRDAGTRSTPDDPFATVWCPVQDLERAGEQVLALARTANVYFGVGLRSARLPEGQRGSSKDVIAIPGLWADLDVKKGAFASEAEAVKFAHALPMKPTVLVGSGHGVHGYWLFKELWAFDSEEPEYAAALLRGWQAFLRAQAAPRIVDSTHDLARVLRVVGTMNRKNGEALPVTLLDDAGPRYNPSDFDVWQDWEESSVKDVPGDFVVRAGAQPPADKFEALCVNDGLFKPAWRETAKNITDQSPSGYAMRLANIAARAGWTNQEICDLLVAFRERKPRDKVKGKWWYAITIAKARSGMTETHDTVRRMDETSEPDEKLACLSELVGFPVRRLVKRRAIDPSGYITPAWYIIETEAGSVEVPDAETIHSLAKMKALIFDRLDRQLKIKSKDWPKALDAMLAVMVTEDAPVESTEYEEMRNALTEYTRGKGAVEDPLKAHEGEYLVKMDSETWFSLRRFGEWCRVVKRMKVGPRNLPKLLEAIGSRRKTLDNLLSGGKRTSTVLWSVPETPLYRAKKKGRVPPPSDS